MRPVKYPVHQTGVWLNWYAAIHRNPRISVLRGLLKAEMRVRVSFAAMCRNGPVPADRLWRDENYFLPE